MKILFMSDVNFSDRRMIGVKNKCNWIYNAFNNNNIETDFFYRDEIYSVLKTKKNILKQIHIMSNKKYEFILETIDKKKYDLLFIRYTLSDVFFLGFLKEVKRRQIKIILEFPTLPYDEEFNDENLLDIDRYFRKNLKKYVDLAVTYNNLDNAFGIKNVFIGNGINIDERKILEYKPLDYKCINLIGVANISKWHGYDRVIKGIYKYINETKKDNIKFSIVGCGEELNNLIKLTHKLGVQKNIDFRGFMQGKELEQIYSKSDLGIGPLSRKRIGMNDGSALKNREYCSIGLSFIYSGYDPDFVNFKYAYNVQDDESPIDISKLIKFIYDVKKDINYINNMRKYAEDHLQWVNKVKIILDELQNI